MGGWLQLGCISSALNSRLGGKEGRSCQGPWATLFQMNSHRLNDINQHFTAGSCCPAKSFTWEARRIFSAPPLAGMWAGKDLAPIYIVLALRARKVISSHNMV